MSKTEWGGTQDVEAVEPAWRGLCRMGGVAAFLMLASATVTMVVVLTLGGEPTTPNEYFTLLGGDRLVGLLRMDLASIATIALYYFVFFGLYAAGVASWRTFAAPHLM